MGGLKSYPRGGGIHFNWKVVKIVQEFTEPPGASVAAPVGGGESPALLLRHPRQYNTSHTLAEGGEFFEHV